MDLRCVWAYTWACASVAFRIPAAAAAAVQGRRVAQAQVQQQAEITFTESLEVVSDTEFRLI